MNLQDKLLEALKGSSFWTPKTRSNQSTIQGLACPACGDASAWAYSDNPMAICCNRLSQCGARTKTVELFPEVRRNIERDFPATVKDPHRPAREYLRSRGLPDHLLADLPFRYLKDARKTGSGAVLFPIGKDEQNKEILNGRLFNPPPGHNKGHNIGSTTGRFWKHPSFAYDQSKKTYITEGILDALSLLALGVQAIAVLASGQDPAKVDLSEFGQKVLSFDNDEAGHQACRKWKQVYPEAEVILCDSGDWNDLLNSGSAEQVQRFFETNLPRYRNNGDLALAETADQWAGTYHSFHGCPPGLFEFLRETYFATLKAPRGSDQAPYVATARCLRARVKVLSFTIDRSNPARPEFHYNLEILPSQQGRRPVAITGSGKDIATVRALNEFLLSGAKIPWEGDAKAATALQAKITGDKKAPEVCLLPVTGYQPEIGAYVFHRWAIDTEGTLIHPDKRGHFQLGYNRYFQPPAHSESKAISPLNIGKERVKEIYRLLGEAWGLNGIAAFSWGISSWFVNQIKEQTNFFPFLSLHGDPASGKSALVTFLNNIQAREGEGLPITQLNSKKGSIRTIGQVSGLFTALLEDNQRNEKGFDYSILLTAYNRGPLQVQAAFSSDLQTKENPFLGTLLFCQNTEPFNTKAERQRTISLQFKADSITDQSRVAYEQLMALDKREISGIIQQVLIRRSYFDNGWQQAFTLARTALAPMSERRVLENHALVLAFHRLFCTCFEIQHSTDLTRFIAEVGRQKCITSSIRQTSIADHFFELLDTLEEDKTATAYHIDAEKGWLVVNLPKVEKLLRDKSYNFQASEPLNIALQQHPSFIRNGLTYRFPHDPESDGSGRKKLRKVWCFALEWFQNNRCEFNE